MPNDEYMKALDKAVADLDERVSKRDLINAEIAGLRETVRVLSSRVILSRDREREVVQLLAAVDYATPNLKDAIRSTLIRSGKQLTAIEVRNALEESGFNFDDFSNPLSACHATLKRMDKDKEVETGDKGGKTSYWIDLKIARPVLPRPTLGLTRDEGLGVRTLSSLSGLGEPATGRGADKITPRTRGVGRHFQPKKQDS